MSQQKQQQATCDILVSLDQKLMSLDQKLMSLDQKLVSLDQKLSSVHFRCNLNTILILACILAVLAICAVCCSVMFNATIRTRYGI
ncbi:hypothetical protein HYH02_012097 [Chlamydomonas schloesseri]|uniref:Uncharacterized protein n=1 Tax=Chlamydomonas schloesseri TaxID=2026947 RepID=A0A835T2V0_9CHLO|nr:hypothetical protein HYH02_012097 [Chlamydomonas schloesseri]|eukprot:KAG2434898.1 hypothetical protein HYH02_012097 [Chlamydomonas schloesseri]